jgi:hypothetical protein
MLTRRVGSVLLVVQGSAAPSDPDWAECLEILQPFVAIARVLVLTEGEGPDASQRQRLSAVIGRHPIRVAIMTDSAKVRFIVASLALFIRRIRCFMRNDLSAAFEHLDLTLAEIDQLTRNIETMQAQIMPPTSTSSASV